MFNIKLNKNLKLNTYSNINPKINLQKHRKNTFFALVSLMFVLALFSFLVYTTTFNDVSPFASAYDVDRTVHDAQELRDAVTASLAVAPAKYVIALANDIELTGSPLTIPATAAVVLISEGGTFMKLIGPDLVNTITVDGGILVIDGIIVTHNNGNGGGGIIVDNGGTVEFYSGEISNNVAYPHVGGGVLMLSGSFSMSGNAMIDNNFGSSGGGVYVSSNGVFSMVDDARVDGNTAGSAGGGVYNLGVFDMLGGVISGNAVSGTSTNDCGGGVYNAGADAVFNMVGGIIGGDSSSEGNYAYNGGGVYNTDGGTFSMSGDAAILGNRATFGGGVYNDARFFNLGDSTSSGIVSVSGNTASYGGGVYNVGADARFNMFGNAVISDNSAGVDGGGVFNVNAGVFNMFGGGILDNTAGTGGGGVCTSGEFNMYDGKISGNSARGAGGVLNYLNFNMSGGEISDNTSLSYGGGVENNASSALGTATFRMSGDAIISNNTAANGGGVYNADGRYSDDSNAFLYMSDDATISGNHAISKSLTAGRGGGVHNCNRGILTMSGNAKIVDNDATYGGGVFNDFDCKVYMSNDASILDNDAIRYGGGVYSWNEYYPSTNPANLNFPSLVSLTDSAIISGNVAGLSGGGIQNTDNSYVVLSGDAAILGNSAGYGGGIYTTSALPDAVKITGGTIADNSARYSGGGIYSSSKLFMSAGVIANNTAAGDGGGVYVVTGGFFELLAGRVSDNVAGNNGGGIWITNTDNFEALEKLYIAYGVEFRDNSASVLISLTSLSVSGEGIYRSQVEIADGSWTNGELFGINNYDISFTGKCIVIYDPGTQGTWRAEQEAYGNLDFGSSTPVFGTASGADYNVDHTYGWSFAGWLPAWSSTVSGDVTYVAQWTNAVEPIFYTVTYVGNGNSGGVAPVDRFSPYVEGERVVVLGSGSLTRDGYVFLGWATSGSASSVSFGVGSAFYISQDMTFYAVWESALYSVEYRPGLHGMFDVQVTVGLSFGDSTPVAPVVTGETGWIFTGWSPTPTTTVTGNAIYIAQWTQQTTPSPSPTPTLTPTVTPSPTPSPSATPTSPPTGTVPPGGGPTPSLSPSTSPSPPIGGDPEGTPAWALINLILTITGAILAIILTIYILLQHNQKQKKQQQKQEQTQKKDSKGQYIAKQQKQKDEKDTYDDHDDVVVERQRRRRLFWFLLSVVMGVAGIIVFILTEDMTKPMVLVDRWTIVNAIILVVEIIAIVFTFKRKGKDETVAYAVRYYLQGTKNPVISSKTSLVGSVGSSVTEYAPAVAGYTVVGDDVASLTLNEDTTKNEIIFYYTPNTKEDKNEQQKKK